MPARAAWRVAARMALVAAVIGTSVTVSATERVTLSLVLAGFLGWSFVPLLQLGTGLLLVRGAEARRRLDLLDRYFALGWAWNLWVVVIHGVLLMWPAGRRLGVTAVGIAAVVPIVWTLELLFDYCRRDLGLDHHGALVRLVQHQVVTYSLVVAYVVFAVSLWPRIVGLFA